MNRKISDSMKKESKKARNSMIFGYTLAVVLPTFFYFRPIETFSENSILLMFLFFFLCGSIGLYSWLYSLKYSVEITSDKIYLKTLFRKTEINLCDVKSYTYNRYMQSVFYLFKLNVNNKKVTITTRYKDQFVQILEERTASIG